MNDFIQQLNNLSQDDLISLSDLLKEDGSIVIAKGDKSITVHPMGGGCTPTSCPTGYYCNGEKCVLDVG